MEDLFKICGIVNLKKGVDYSFRDIVEFYDYAEKYPEISRRLTEKEYQKVLDYLDTTELDGFLQELSSASEEYVPDFNLI